MSKIIQERELYLVVRRFTVARILRLAARLDESCGRDVNGKGDAINYVLYFVQTADASKVYALKPLNKRYRLQCADTKPCRDHREKIKPACEEPASLTPVLMALRDFKLQSAPMSFPDKSRVFCQFYSRRDFINT